MILALHVWWIPQLFIGTVFWVGLAVVVVGAGVTAYGQVQAGKAADALGRYNAQQEEINASAATRDANIQANQIRERNRLIAGKQYAAYAASGVAADTGSPLLVESKTRANLEMGALEAERQGGIEASKDLQQAEIDRIEGKNALTGSRYAATGTILQGIGGAASGIGTHGMGSAAKTTSASKVPKYGPYE